MDVLVERVSVAETFASASGSASKSGRASPRCGPVFERPKIGPHVIMWEVVQA